MDNKRIACFGTIFFVVVLLLNLVENFFHIKTPIFFDLIKILQALAIGGVFFLLLNYLRGSQKENTKLALPTLLLFTVFSAYKIIFVYTNNFTRIPFIFILDWFLILVALFLVLWLFFGIISKNYSKAAVVSLVIVLFASVDFPVDNWLHSYVCGVFLFALLLIFSDTNKIVSFIRSFASVLLILCFVNGVWQFTKTKLLTAAKPLNYQAAVEISKVPERNIYMILLDAYAGEETLENLGTNNFKFVSQLKDLGFTVYPDMNSNYDRTLVSVPSFLNFNYIENLPFDNPSDGINNAMIFKMAKRAGYKITYFNSHSIEFFLKKGIIDEFYDSTYAANADLNDILMGKTLLGIFAYDKRSKTNVKDFKYFLQLAKNTIRRDDNAKKHFMFMHFLMPHDPYLFAENGKLNPLSGGLDVGFYSGFLKYTNQKTLEIVDEIFAQEKSKGNKPIIVIFGDHGVIKIKDDKVDKDSDEVRLSFNTFLAYYNPDYVPEYYKKTDCLINFSRNFANEIFGVKMENLPLRQIWFANYWPRSFKNIENFGVEI